jgi:uncharacterized protein with FMN-binding domain
MSVLTAAVAGVSVRSSMHHETAGSAAGLAPAGVDGGAARTPAPSGGRTGATASGTRHARKGRRSSSGSGTASVTVTGKGEQTPYGPVQVQVTVAHDRITAARALAHPEGGHSTEVNAYAVPVLDQETVHSQGRQVDAVSGATYTSEGYQQSLQSALDAAHLHHLL